MSERLVERVKGCWQNGGATLTEDKLARIIIREVAGAVEESDMDSYTLKLGVARWLSEQADAP